MGSVVSPQPSMFAGVTTEPGYSDGGGKVGSGDISVPYNPGGRKKVFQKISADNRKGTNKRRKNKIRRVTNFFNYWLKNRSAHNGTCFHGILFRNI
jgi:hypothetical protein